MPASVTEPRNISRREVAFCKKLNFMFTHTEAHLRGATEDHTDVTGELSRPDNRDQNLVQCRWANDLDLTSLQYKERHVGLAAVDRG